MLLEPLQHDEAEPVAIKGRRRRVLGALGGVAGVVVGTAIVGGAILVLTGFGLGETVSTLWKGSFGTVNGLGGTLSTVTPLLMVTIGLVPALRVRLYNVGGPGQMGLGALAAAVIGLHAGGLPGPLLLTVTAVAAVVGGVVAAVIPAVLAAKLRVSEVLTTLIMNFIIAALLEYLLSGPLQGSYGNLPQTNMMPARMHLPVLIPRTPANASLLICAVGVVALAFWDKTGAGYRLRLFGGNEALASRVGISRVRMVVYLMCFGGATAGLAGWMELIGIDGRLFPTVGTEIVGYLGLLAAFLGGLSPWGIVAACVIFSAMIAGGNNAQVVMNFDPYLITALLGVGLFIFAMTRGIRRRQSGA